MVKNYKKRPPAEACEKRFNTYRSETAFALSAMDRRDYKRDKLVPATATGGSKASECSQIVPPQFPPQTDDFSVIFLFFLIKLPMFNEIIHS